MYVRQKLGREGAGAVTAMFFSDLKARQRALRGGEWAWPGLGSPVWHCLATSYSAHRTRLGRSEWVSRRLVFYKYCKIFYINKNCEYIRTTF